MVYHFLADVVLVFHFTFILFAVLGGLLVLRWRRVAWFHLPIVAYAALIEFFGWVCPLTPLENWFRVRGGGAEYTTSFIEHYLLPVIYPTGLTLTVRIILGTLVLAVNLAVYGWLLRRQLRPS